MLPYRIQTLSTRYPSFGGANLIQPPVFHRELFTPQCASLAEAEGLPVTEEKTAPTDGLDSSNCASGAAILLTCIDFFQARPRPRPTRAVCVPRRRAVRKREQRRRRRALRARDGARAASGALVCWIGR